MYKIDFEHPIHIHFIGIGGISMSGLAEILLKEGFTVSGSDTKESPLTKKLESEGAHIIYGQNRRFNIGKSIEVYYYDGLLEKKFLLRSIILHTILYAVSSDSSSGQRCSIQ